MRVVRHRATAHAYAGPSQDSSSQELKARLRSMHDHCLTELAGALEAVCSGDLTVTVTPVPRETRIGFPRGHARAYPQGMRVRIPTVGIWQRTTLGVWRKLPFRSLKSEPPAARAP